MTKHYPNDVSINNINKRQFYCNILKFRDWETIKKLYKIDNFFCDFTTLIKDYKITGLYEAFYKILLIIELMILKYKNFAAYYPTLSFYDYFFRKKIMYKTLLYSTFH